MAKEKAKKIYFSIAGNEIKITRKEYIHMLSILLEDATKPGAVLKNTAEIKITFK